MSAVRTDDVVIFSDSGTSAGGNGLFAEIWVQIAANKARPIQFGTLKLKLAGGINAAVHLQQYGFIHRIG